jgi:hypothetical protein
MMGAMIKLRLDSPTSDFSSVQKIAGLADVPLDPKFGLVCLDPKNQLFAVRADHVSDWERRRDISPEILGVYGDTRVSTTGSDQAAHRPAVTPKSDGQE